MDIYAIGDLHLSGSVNKPMDIFGDKWQEHDAQIMENWKRVVKEQDIVLVPGDISWAMTLDEALVDLEFIHQLPGQKIFIKGNHDYWWQSVTQLNDLYHDMHFLQNTSFSIGKYAICGSRGWTCPSETEIDQHDIKIYNREAKRLELSLQHAKELGCEKMIVMLHYPPTNEKKADSLFTELFKKYQVKQVVYGHLHGDEFFDNSLRGMHRGINYTLVSADAISFCPHKIIQINQMDV